MGKPIEVANVRYTTAMAEPVNGSGPMGKGSVFVAGLVAGLLLGSGAISCENQDSGDSKSGDQKASVQVQK